MSHQLEQPSITPVGRNTTHIQAPSHCWQHERRLVCWGIALTLLGWLCGALVSPNSASRSLLSPDPTHVTSLLPQLCLSFLRMNSENAMGWSLRLLSVDVNTPG